jgi:class 3 adenylate cyclase
VELPGSDHLPWIGDVDRAVEEIQAFLSAVKDEDAVLDRLLATVLFTDIVGSTERARELGDRAWGELLEAHHGRVRAQLARFRWRGSAAARSTPRVMGFWRPSTVRNGLQRCIVTAGRHGDPG